MKIAKLHYITQGTSENAILEEIYDVVNAGVPWIQLRIKDNTLHFEGIAKAAKEICKGKAVFIINDNVAVAKSVDSDGVHLGLTDTPIVKARATLGKHKIIGGTANTLRDCLMRQREGADYIGLGPYKFTTTKKNLSPILGLSGYTKITNDIRLEIPILAIGGIDFEDIQLLKSIPNIWGIAVSGLIKHSTNKTALIKDIKTILTLNS